MSRQREKDEGTKTMKNHNMNFHFLSVTTVVAVFIGLVLWVNNVQGQTLADYTAYPPTMPESAPPNILFLVDVGEQTLRAAYSGSNHEYPVSFKAGTATSSTYAANVTVGSLVSVDAAGNSINTSGTTSPSDTFDSTKTYTGLFDPLRCYSYASGSFGTGTDKSPAVVSTTCADKWDGNFLNWLTMRNIDAARQALIGGTTDNPDPDTNSDGTLNKIQGEPNTGENGDNAVCSGNGDTCWRYVKWVPNADLQDRVPNIFEGGGLGGQYFGSGEGNVWIDTNNTDPFSGSHYRIQISLNGESTAYKQQRSWGLFQDLNNDNMHVGVEFTRASAEQGGTIIVHFDEFDMSYRESIVAVREEPVKDGSPISEALYEGLCYYRNSQGQCYGNSGSGNVNYDPSVGAPGDPFYFASLNQLLGCCKSNVLLLSAGVGQNDGKSPDEQQPFGDLLDQAVSNLGITGNDAVGVQLDDVSFYGQTNDIRGDLSATQNVTFWAVNAMGSAAGAQLLASASKYGGFEDQDSDGQVDLSGQSCTYPAGSSLGSGSSTSSAEWDKDQDCIPDTYFEAADANGLRSALDQAVGAILDRAASGTAVSVLATSATGEGAVYQSFYYPSQFEGLNEIKWTGYTRGLFVDTFGNLREDTDADAKLVYENDYIIQTRFDSSTNEVKVDRFRDVSPTDGKADTATPFETVSLKDITPIWEAGKLLALKDPATRKILTWTDTNNDGAVDAGEQIEFKANSPDNSATLAPYLRAASSGTFTSANIINFIRGQQISGLRDRQLTVSGSLKVWKLGDPIHSTPTIVAAPQERYDVIYGDASYAEYVRKYKARRQVAYVGANDGMLHAFNVGYYHAGDDPSSTTSLEHGYFTRTPTDNSSGPLLGEELWGFIPQALLPHLRWLAQSDYTHVYYVDLKPKVTDARIFAADVTHPNGWGTILIGGFRLGGSCGVCTASTGAPPMSITADFGSGSETRTFYSAYFVLDITDPEQDPTLLWVFTDSTLGLGSSYPTVVRANPSGDAKTSNTNAKWFFAVGSGMTKYVGESTQTGKLFALEMPKPFTLGSSLVSSEYPTSDANAVMADMISLDKDLNYRTDTMYVGNAFESNNPDWKGTMYRLTTNGGAIDATNWGVSVGGVQKPSALLASFTCSPAPCGGNRKVGPVTAAPTVTRDTSQDYWVFFGTGRYYSTADKTYADTQYFIGVKDPVMSGGCTESSVVNCEQNDLVEVSNAQVCVVCSGGTTQVTGVTGVTTVEGSTTTSLQGLVQSKDGWWTTLPATRERALVAPTLVGGIVFFPTFIPVADACSSSGNSNLYALFYLTGSAYTQSIIGTETAGADTNVKRSTQMGVGMASRAAIHMGGQGSDAGSGVTGRLNVCSQTSTGAMSCTRSSPALTSWSHFVSWLKQQS